MKGYILLGYPGSGKGTLGQFMRSFDIELISSGDILRSEIQEGTAFGKQTEHLVKEGKQVPDALITEIILKRLQRCKQQGQSFVLDGFPQTLPQLESFHAFLAKLPDCPTTFICVEVTPDTAFERMTGRITCMSCETIYHQSLRPPVREGRCDRCDIPLFERGGDRPEKARARLSQFDRTTKNVMESVSKLPNAFSIDGNGSIESVREQLLTILKK